jgi:predicted permease
VGLKVGGGRTAWDGGGGRTRGALVVAEVALSLILLIGAGLMIRTLEGLRGVHPGLDVNDVLTLRVNVPSAKYAAPAQRTAFYDRVLERVRALPGVDSAAAVDTLPLIRAGSMQPIAVEGAPPVPMADQPEVAVRVITPGYLRSLRIPLKKGRDFDDDDIVGRMSVVLVSESMARQFWPGEDPIGRRLTLTFAPGAVREVVGVVGDVKIRGVDVLESVSTLYWPEAQAGNLGMSLVVRSASRTADLVPAVTGVIRGIDPELPVLDVRTMDDVLGGTLAQQRVTMLLLAAFAGLALFLAALGIYGVLSYAVRRRRQEIGIRMALGARRSDVLRLVMAEGLRLTFIGLAVGVAAALPLTGLLRDLLFGVTPTDPATFVAVAALLGLVALAACYLPARRAMRVDPMVAIRAE